MKTIAMVIVTASQALFVVSGHAQSINMSQSAQKIAAIKLVKAELLPNSTVAATFIYENTSENDIYAEMMFGFPDYRDSAKTINQGDDNYRYNNNDRNAERFSAYDVYFTADNEEVIAQRVELIRWQDIKTKKNCIIPSQCEALKTVTFKWKQYFPAGKKVVITYNYSDGRDIEDGAPNKFAAEIIKADQKFGPYCVEENIAKSLERTAKGKENVSTRLTFIGPFLSPSGPWADKLAHQQRIIVNKPPIQPDLKNQVMVSFCGDNVKKNGDTQFELNFTDKVFQSSFRLLTLDTFWW